MDRNVRTIVAYVFIAIAVLVSAYWIHDALVTQAAMENGYQQVIVDGELVWRKRPGERFAKAVKWLVEIAVEFF